MSKRAQPCKTKLARKAWARAERLAQNHKISGTEALAMLVEAAREAQSYGLGFAAYLPERVNHALLRERAALTDDQVAALIAANEARP